MSESHGHGHGHHHDHAHGEEQHVSYRNQSAVVLDIGGELGALIVHTSAEHDEREIDISPGTDPNAARSHNQVHPRRMRTHTVYSAVYPQLREGVYTLWRDRHTAEATVTITGGRVTEYRFTG
jgi:predicted amino acid racemase